MAHTTLTSLFTDIADAIRAKLGSSSTIVADDFPTAIASISTGGEVKRGVIRPDAELIQTWSLDQMAVADLGLIIPAYSTSSQTLKASETLATYTGDPTNYRYYIVERTLTTPTYSISTISRGRQDYAYNTLCYEWVYQGQGEVTSLDKSKTASQNSQILSTSSLLRDIYWSSGTAIAIQTTGYGCHQGITAPTVTSNKTLTIKSPTITMRGNAAYFPQTFFDAVTDFRCQYKIELWRIPFTTSGAQGWSHYSQVKSIEQNIANGGTLT